MSDNETDEEMEVDVNADDVEQIQQNPIEYVEDLCERNQNSWLRFPAEFIRPAKMCSINKYVQCVDQGFLQHSMHHIPTGPAYVLVGHDSPSLPPHMFQWIWAMSQINAMRQHQGCVIPVDGMTDVVFCKKGRQLLATNIKRRLAVSQGWQMDDQMRFEKWFSDMGGKRETMMMESIQELRQGDNFYAEVNPLQMLWSIVPVEYTLGGAKVRRIFHVLKTIPAPGFDLMRCLIELSRKGDQKMANGVPYAKVLQTVQEVINYECNRNLNIVGFFGRSHPLPHPMQVLDDPSSPMNPQAILSPFLVMRKILLQLPVSELTDLVVDGFPKTDTVEHRERCFRFFAAMQTAYRRRLAYYHRVFTHTLAGLSASHGGGGAKGGNKQKDTQPMPLPLVLSSAEDECLDNVYSFMNMTFNLNRWLDGGTAALERAEMLRMPQLAIATLTPFQYVSACDVLALDFIRAHIGDPGEDLDETKLHRKYSMDNGSWGDMPHAGMFKNARESIRTSLKTMKQGGDPLERMVSTYKNYMHAQSTIHAQAVLADLMMSDRVLNCAQCLDRLGTRINAGVRRAFTRKVPGEVAKQQREAFAAYPDAAHYLHLLHAFSLHNKSIRANAVNLTTLWAIMVSDTLTHLGAHHETWNWMMYTVQVMGGAGHLRAQTDDHGSKSQVTFTSKPNSVGFNAVITKTFKALSTMVTELLPDLSSDFLETMRFMKLDRTTRAGVESVSAVMFVNGVREQAPDRKTFMRPIIMDEGYRSMDAAALNGMVCSIPRDSDGGSGNILKAVDPGKSGGAHLQGHQRQIPGLSPFLLAMTSNSNPHTTVIGECIKTFSVVTAMFPAGAQPGGKLGSILANKTRTINDYQASNTNAASTLPTTNEDREDLAWVMCVLLMATRQLALVNKTGQVNFEINTVCRMFVEWIRNIIQQHFMPFFSAMLFLSYDRVIAGYLTRQVATTFMATCARHYAGFDTAGEANTQILLDMESAPVTLHTCNLAISNAVTHMVDTNLILVNQLIRDRLQTPVIPLKFLVAIMKGETLDMASGYYEQIFAWMSQTVQMRGNDAECMMGYLSVPKLGTIEDYTSKEAFLESNFGVAKNNYYTYLTAIRECCSKTFDMTNFLSTDLNVLDFTRFTSRLGVGGDGMLQGYQQQNPATVDHGRTTYLFTQATQDAQQPQQRAGIGKAWVNIIQHLLVTSIQGTKDLHADNMFLFGANLTEFILSRCAPIQSMPAGVAVYESYIHSHEEVVPLHKAAGDRPQYFVRTINDHNATVTGEASELPAVLGPHPPEDAMHLGSWIQLHTILHNGAKPGTFEYLPEYNGRPPELVLGRRYPLVGAESIGTIMLNPTSTVSLRLSRDSEVWESGPRVELSEWWKFLCDKKLMVAPLIFRDHAVFRPDVVGTHPWVSKRFDDDGQFLSKDGRYQMARSEHEVATMDFLEAHSRLLPLGAHMIVRSRAVASYNLQCTEQWVVGCLRYPEADVEDQEELLKVCVTIQLKETSSSQGGAIVVSVSPADCRILSDDRRRVCNHAIRPNTNRS